MSDNTLPVRMSDWDAFIWQLEDDPNLRSTVVSIALLDRAPDRDKMRLVAERLTRMVPRYREIVRPDPLRLAPPRWEADTEFNLDYHLRWTSAPAPGDLDALLSMTEPIGMQSFDLARPLWEWTVVEGLADGRAALISKVHHAISDGVGGQTVAMALYDFSREPAEVAPLPQLPALVSPPRNRVVDAVGHEVRFVASSLGWAASSLTRGLGALVRHPRTSVQAVGEFGRSAGRVINSGPAPLSDVMVKRSKSVRYGTLTIPLEDLKRSAKAGNGKLNDAFVAALATGLHHYHREHSSTVSKVRMAMPVNTRTTSSTTAGNHFTGAVVELPIGPAEAGDRIATARALVGSLRDEPAMVVAAHSPAVARHLPQDIFVPLMGRMQRGVDMIASNVPGSSAPVFFGGALLERIIPLGPLVGAALNVTLLSHLDHVTVGVVMDAAAVPDAEAFMGCLRKGFDDVLEVGAST